MRTAFFLFTALAALSGVAGPLVVFNEDSNRFLRWHVGKYGDEPMTKATLTEYIDQFLKGPATVYSVCVNDMTSFTPLKTFETRFEIHDAIKCSLSTPGCEHDRWMKLARRAAADGIDPQAVFIARIRARGVTPWISMRMNDLHHISEPDNCAVARHWKEHPELHCDPNWFQTKKGSLYLGAYNYAKAEVRQLHLAQVKELVSRYDVDGIELDFMRHLRHFAPGREREDAHFLTDFIRDVRREVDAEAVRKGRPLTVAVRVATRLETAQALGTDVLAWAKEGLVDVVITGNEYCEVDFGADPQEWMRELKAANPKVRFVPGRDLNLLPEQLFETLRGLTLAEQAGWLELNLAAGVDGVYFFNHMYVDRSSPDAHYFNLPEYDYGRIAASPRVYPVVYVDSSVKLPPEYRHRVLPCAVGEKRLELPIRIGRAKGVGEVAVCFGFSLRPDPDVLRSIRLNGVAATGFAEGAKDFFTDRKDLRKGNCVLRFAFPPAALRDGANVVTVEGGGKAHGWLYACALVVSSAPNVIYNTDGGDLYLYPDDKPITEEAFLAERIDFAKSPNVGTVSYCPQSSGFGYFTCSKAGDWMTNAYRRVRGGRPCHNATAEFAAKGLDPLEMCGRFCRRHGKKLFLSIRVNDMHDAAGTIDAPNPHFSPFKKAHPECLFGTGRRKANGRPDIARWSGVDFSHAVVRDYMRDFVRAFATNYDFDGIEYDFNRHLSLFASVVRGGAASNAERELMTGLMRELREITNAAARRRGHPIRVHVRMPDSVDYLREVGIDAEKWFAEKLVDAWIGAGYFRLNAWRASVAVAHRHGIAFYASLDESRVPEKVRKNHVPMLPGRVTAGADGQAFYAARIANALAEGCDGVYLFNLEGHGLQDVAEACGRLEEAPKRYFASARGSGAARPWHYLKGGERFLKRTAVDPLSPLPLQAEWGPEIEIAVGDARPGPTTLSLATDMKAGGEIVARINGVERRLKVGSGGVAREDLEDGAVLTGLNKLTFRLPEGTSHRLYDLNIALKMSNREGRAVAPRPPSAASLDEGEQMICAGEEASLSPDGRQFVFQRAQGDDYALYVRDRQTGEERRISPEGGSAVHPEWGPGGQLVWSRGHEMRTALAAKADGTGWNLESLSNGVVRTLTKGRHRVFAPSFGPDGSIYFVSEVIKPAAGSTDVYSGNRTGVGVLTGGMDNWYRKVIVLNESNTGVADPHVSSDGRLLVRAEVAGYTVPWRIVVSPLGDPDKRTYLTGKDMVGVSPVFSPDAKRVAFCGCREGDEGWRIYLVDTMGGELRPFARGEHPSFTPDGKAVVYDRDGVIYRKELP